MYLGRLISFWAVSYVIGQVHVFGLFLVMSIWAVPMSSVDYIDLYLGRLYLLISMCIWVGSFRFEQEMDKLKHIDAAAYEWLASKDAKHWSRAFFSTFSTCDILLNNLCEVFNAAILEARDKPIITCIKI